MYLVTLHDQPNQTYPSPTPKEKQPLPAHAGTNLSQDCFGGVPGHLQLKFREGFDDPGSIGRINNTVEHVCH
jgi:hypothetical protein